MKDLNWDTAHEWQELANLKKVDNEPKWGWDCGFKLDFDGELLSINSRFYPPHKNNGDYWEGNLHVCLFGDDILTKEFKCDTLDELKKDVEDYLKHYKGILKAKINR